MSALTSPRLVFAGLRHHWRAHLALGLGFALAATVLVGALLVGDSARGSLRERALARIGRADAALVGGERLFRAALADDLGAALGAGASSAPAAVLALPASASAGGGARRANGVSVLGVDARFFALAPDTTTAAPQAGEVALSTSLAARLAVEVGDEVLLRVAKPSALPLDMVLAPTEDTTLALRARVSAVLGPEGYARFALVAGPRDPGNAFVDREWLARALEQPGRANLILVASAGGGPTDPGVGESTRAALASALRDVATLEDLELALAPSAVGDGLELSTPRVFLDAALSRAAAGIGARPPLGVLTYFVNALRGGEAHGSVPYSMVAALGPLRDGPRPAALEALLPADLASDEVVVGDWLARDLGLAAGQDLELAYWLPGSDRELREETRTLRVRSVAPLAGLADDPTLMPAFPGLEGSEDCRDWEPGVPIDLDAIRDVDERYWDDHRGTPKAFVSLALGRELWSSRFGDLTAVRFDPATSRDDVVDGLRAALDPAELGLAARDLRGPALRESDTPTDFGGLFLALSFFLIGAALLLSALLVAFGVEARASEVGLYLALGFRPARVKRLLFGEVAAAALAGSLVGAALGALYTRAMLAGLASGWRGAVAATPIAFHARAATLALGAVCAFLASAAAARWTLRGQVRRSAVDLLGAAAGVGDPSEVTPARKLRRSTVSRAVAAVALVGALALAFTAPAGSGPDAALSFFGAGALLCLAGLTVARLWIARRAAGRGSAATVRALGIRNAGRRPGRSLAIVALLAWGTFLVVSIGVHRRGDDPASLARDGGTGGFALLLEASVPLAHDLATPEGRAGAALDGAAYDDVSFVPLRVREGDEASCLNLAAPQQPRLVGVDPEELARRGAFSFARAPAGEARPWDALARSLDDGAVPAIGDQASVQWTLHKAVGDTLDYVDERGEPLRVRLVGTLADSILQGDLLIAEDAFRARFPSASGYRRALVDAPAARADEVATELARALSTEGVEVVPTARRLAEFHAVQNAYLTIFQLLGGLGVGIGSLGVAIVALRNALERRGELSALGAIGFSRARRRALLAWEHLPLVALGLAVGVVAAGVALVPAWRAGAAAGALGQAPWLVVVTAAVSLTGVLATAWAATRGDDLDGLRGE